jgi:hypothetical protein
LIIVAAVFSFVSGYSIGTHSDQAESYRMTIQPNSPGVAIARAAEKAPQPAAPSGGYGAPAPADSSQGQDSGAAPGYGTPSPGYGAPAPAPGYGQ